MVNAPNAASADKAGPDLERSAAETVLAKVQELTGNKNWVLDSTGKKCVLDMGSPENAKDFAQAIDGRPRDGIKPIAAVENTSFVAIEVEGHRVHSAKYLEQACQKNPDYAAALKAACAEPLATAEASRRGERPFEKYKAEAGIPALNQTTGQQWSVARNQSGAYEYHMNAGSAEKAAQFTDSTFGVYAKHFSDMGLMGGCRSCFRAEGSDIIINPRDASRLNQSNLLASATRRLFNNLEETIQKFQEPAFHQFHKTEVVARYAEAMDALMAAKMAEYSAMHTAQGHGAYFSQSSTQNRSSFQYSTAEQESGFFSWLLEKGTNLAAKTWQAIFGEEQSESHGYSYQRSQSSQRAYSTAPNSHFVHSFSHIEDIEVQLKGPDGKFYGTMQGQRTTTRGADGSERVSYKFSDEESQKLDNARRAYREANGKYSEHETVGADHPWKLEKLKFLAGDRERLAQRAQGEPVVTSYAADGHSYSSQEIQEARDFAAQYLRPGVEVVPVMGPDNQIGVCTFGVTTSEFDAAKRQQQADKERGQEYKTQQQAYQQSGQAQGSSQQQFNGRPHTHESATKPHAVMKDQDGTVIATYHTKEELANAVHQPAATAAADVDIIAEDVTRSSSASAFKRAAAMAKAETIEYEDIPRSTSSSTASRDSVVFRSNVEEAKAAMANFRNIVTTYTPAPEAGAVTTTKPTLRCAVKIATDLQTSMSAPKNTQTGVIPYSPPAAAPVQNGKTTIQI